MVVRRTILRNRDGTLAIPLSLALLILLFSALALWGLLRHWQKLTEIQLRLDKCTGQAALELRNTINFIETANGRIEKIRIALASATLTGALAPEAVVALRAALTSQIALQDLRKAKWQLKRVSWLATGECTRRGDRPVPLPSLDCQRDPPDEIGQRPLRWKGEVPEDFQIAAYHSPRAAGARVARQKGKEWHAEWY